MLHSPRRTSAHTVARQTARRSTYGGAALPLRSSVRAKRSSALCSGKMFPLSCGDVAFRQQCVP
eukprot:4374984-Alexandrium_andersonii.AAC.1